MTIRVAIEHRTTYTFDEPVKVYPHTVRLRPAAHSRTPIDSYSLQVSPREHFLNWQQDPFGNWMARLVFPEPVSELDILVNVVADMTTINPFDFFVEDYAETFPFYYPEELRRELEPYLAPVSEDDAQGAGPGPVVRQWVSDNVSLPEGGLRIVDFLVLVNGLVNRDIAYTVRMETGVQSPDHTLTARLGSCRDSAWLLVSVLRQLGLAARFVSGYLVQLTADIAAVDGPSGPAEDFTDLHAWAEVYVPGAGWIGLDATSGLFAAEGHIPLSATPHPSSAAPISGATAPVGVQMSFVNRVSRVYEDARVTLPYSEQQWAGVDALGRVVDERLTELDVRLTMGGEPTFVSVDDMASAQWQSAADGTDKRDLAQKLAARLRRRWAPQGVVHHGQGKWYPGEPLPRWAISLLWRGDGETIWTNQDLLDNPWGEPVLETGSRRASDAIRDLALGIAARTGVPAAFTVPAYEDPLAQLLDEARRPAGEERPDDLDPEHPLNADAAARAELAEGLDEEQLEKDLSTPQGWIVPIFRNPEGAGWGTAQWRMRRKHVILIPGTSTMGMRLPLSSLAWTEAPWEPERSPFDERGQLPSYADAAADAAAAAQFEIAESPRTALCVEERDGHLFVFLPPLTHIEDALALVAAVEGSAGALGLPVVLEGYNLPGDHRIKTLSVTPDPGVIEVNVQPTASWAELSELTTTLYEDARQVRLGTEKFDVDGTHTGTGGGNHFTLGGASSDQSPMLRRPDLLRSMLTYWQHHPALSYIFSGRFIGPTSQAPRVDEGRHETLYELEIAFDELARTTGGEISDLGRFLAEDKRRDESYLERRARQLKSPPWLVDRLLRHLLTDLTGNTHRSEFCIDKLYSPESDRGRLGLLEMRGFEMPPHPQMSLVQALLVRTLVLKFWDEPYTGSLVRWGAQLHDRFLLPSYAAADLRDVIADLNRYLSATLGADAPRFEESWFEPFLEFRFPRLGEADIAGVHLELRQGIEPWNVLGEEIGLSGTSRYVDSSVERVQVAAEGMIEGRHVLTCNGVPVPMRAGASSGWGSAPAGIGGAPGRQVGGVRFRAWAPPSALHPTIGVHSPLVFDLVDRWNSRSLGGFTYHVVHPGGRSYEDFPVNAMAAESRRASRFSTVGHSAGPVDLTRWPQPDSLMGVPGEEFPYTLDLRRFLPGDRG